MTQSVTGRRVRRAARILVLDPGERLLLFRFEIAGAKPFWATVGGACDPGESFDDAARRELFEETGIAADPGPWIEARSNDFTTVEGEDVTADERYFVVRVAQAPIDISGHTELEREIILEHRWFSRAELSDWHETIWPADLGDLIGQVSVPDL